MEWKDGTGDGDCPCLFSVFYHINVHFNQLTELDACRSLHFFVSFLTVHLVFDFVKCIVF